MPQRITTQELARFDFPSPELQSVGPRRESSYVVMLGIESVSLFVAEKTYKAGADDPAVRFHQRNPMRGTAIADGASDELLSCARLVASQRCRIVAIS